MMPLEVLAAALADRYRIERELGRGGMATVYLAHDLKHDRPVAIKVLHEDLGATLGPERFLAEIKTTAKLQHPHILALLDSGAVDGLLYYVMPYVEGETLRARLTREVQLPIDDALRIAREVLDALEHAHGHGIVHRDIKPENILLQGGHAMVADFGIALAVQQAGGARMTQTGLSLGTPHYMAPEQAMGERVVDHRADVYALGAVTYEMITGAPPFTGANVQAIIARVMSSVPEPPSTIRPAVPPHVETAILTALARLPADRWPTATAFRLALADTGARSPGARPHGGRAWSGRERAAMLVALAAGAVAVAGWGIVLARTGPVDSTGCARFEGVWSYVSDSVRGHWIVRDGYGVEFTTLRSTGAPRGSSWRYVECTDSTARMVTLESNLTESVMMAGKVVEDVYRIEGAVMVWQHRNPDGTLSPEYRSERIR